MHSHQRSMLLRRAAVIVAMFSAWMPATLVSAAENAPAVGETNPEFVKAIWRLQRVQFEFRGDPVAYTCESFKKKVRAVLTAVGVHPSLIVEARCTPTAQAPFVRAPDPANLGREGESVTAAAGYQTTRLSNRISAVIAFAAPAPATEKNIREQTTFNSKHRLAARVKGEELPTAADIPIFPAAWAPISLTSEANAWLEASDCDLLRQLSKQVLPKIGVEVVRSKFVCSASVTSKPLVEVKALLPVVSTQPQETNPE